MKIETHFSFMFFKGQITDMNYYFTHFDLEMKNSSFVELNCEFNAIAF